MFDEPWLEAAGSNVVIDAFLNDDWSGDLSLVGGKSMMV